MIKNAAITLLLLLFSSGCVSIAEDRTAAGSSDLTQFAQLMDRSFKTPTTDKENIILDRRVRITNPAMEGIWFYTQLNTGKDYKLYRQRLSHLSLSGDGKTIIQKAYGLIDPVKFANAWKNPALLRSMTKADYKPYFDDGCEQRWSRQADGSWYGHVNPKSCKIFSKRRNKHIHIESEGRLSATEYQTNERGFDTDGKFLWGTKPGEYITLYPLPGLQE